MKKQSKTIFKTLITVIIMFGVSAFTFKQTSGPATTTLKVKVSGIRSAEGDIRLLIFNKSAGFPVNPEMAYRHVKGKATTGEITVDLVNIPFGTYSIVAFHDVNANQRFDKSWFGSPQEDYGFSNIPGEYCGTPSFQQTSFIVNQTANSVTVKLMNIK